MTKLTSTLFLLCLIEFASAQTNTTQGVGVGTLGNYNSLFGYYAGNQNTGFYNSSLGAYTLRYNTTGSYNTAMGSYSLLSNMSGSQNIGVGYASLRSNISGSRNVAVGPHSLYINSGGNENVALGSSVLFRNEGGSYNVAAGSHALGSNTSGNRNVAMGYNSLRSNTTGYQNLSIGDESLRSNTTGVFNVSLGSFSSYDNVGGSFNTSIGYESGAHNDYDYSTAIGCYSTVTASDQIRIGIASTQSIGGYRNWTNLSDGRFKKEVEEDVMGLDFIKALRPVSYYVDNKAVNEFLGVDLEEAAVNNKKQYQTGFIAQEVEATAKELGFEHFGGVDAPENEESHYGLRYAEFVVPLVKSVQELSEQNETQAATIKTLKEAIAQQQIQINTLLSQSNNTLDVDGINRATKAQLHQNIPNPFTNETQINLFVPQEVGQALIQVCTIDGKQLFVKEVEGRNETSVVIEGNNLAAGIYMYTLIVDNEIITSKRMVLTK